MPFQIIRNDITKVSADVIVNSANPEPIYAEGVDGCIYKAAGEKSLLAERAKIGDIARGDMAVTPAFKLDAKYIFHTVGPIWKDGESGEFEVLHSCYRKCLDKALELKCKRIAFPLIATGVYGFPKAGALSIAIDEIGSFLMRDDVDDMEVMLVVYDNASFVLTQNLFSIVASFIDDEDVKRAYSEEYHLDEDDYEMMEYRRRREWERMRGWEQEHAVVMEESGSGSTGKGNTPKPFNEDTFDPADFMDDGKEKLYYRETLIRYMNEKGMDSNEVWKGANMTRKAFSKIMTGETKAPQKKAALAICISLKLDLESARNLLASGDMAFNPDNKRDRLVMDCIMRGQYNIFEIDVMLETCNLPTIGS